MWWLHCALGLLCSSYLTRLSCFEIGVTCCSQPIYHPFAVTSLSLSRGLKCLQAACHFWAAFSLSVECFEQHADSMHGGIEESLRIRVPG
jgi:hypothetical protein